MADIALDADALRRDRQRYQRLLDQVEQQVAAWNERAEHLRTTIGGLDHLLELAADGGPAQLVPASRAGRSSVGGPGPAPGPAATVTTPRRAKPRTQPNGRAKAAGDPPPATATPAAPEPVEPTGAPAADAPRGTDALRIVLESEPQRTWALPDLLEALGTRGWLPTSRRPEEGVRISLKRLVERGGAERLDDGRWRRAGAPGPEPAPRDPADDPADDPAADPAAVWPEADPPLAPAPAAEEPPPPAPPPPRPRPASFGRPVGGTVTEL